MEACYNYSIIRRKKKAASKVGWTLFPDLTLFLPHTVCQPSCQSGPLSLKPLLYISVQIPSPTHHCHQGQSRSNYAVKCSTNELYPLKVEVMKTQKHRTWAAPLPAFLLWHAFLLGYLPTSPLGIPSLHTLLGSPHASSSFA